MEFAQQYTVRWSPFLAYPYPNLSIQDVVHSIIHEQQECTRVGLRYLQISANKTSLQELCEKKDIKYQNALKEYTKGGVYILNYLLLNGIRLANEHFQQIKSQSKEILETSRRVLNAAIDEVREEYHQIEEVRLRYEREEKEARERGLLPPDVMAVDFRTVEELKAELETQKAMLDLNTITHPGVVEQYEKRMVDVSTFVMFDSWYDGLTFLRLNIWKKP